MARDNKIALIFVINGEDQAVEDVNVNQPLAAARNHALAESKNTGRPPEEWEVRDAQGTVLPTDVKVADFNFEVGARLYLSLRVGAGG
jgi:hypothetical protein